MNNSKTRQKIWILIFIIALVGLYIFIYLVPRVSNMFTESYRAEYGQLEIGSDIEALLIRNEQVYKADMPGKVKRNVASGKLMRRGSNIVEVDGIKYYNQKRGVVSYYYDGFETVVTPETMEATEESILERFRPSKGEKEKKYSVEKCVSKDAEAGDELFKIVDNTAWYLMCWLDSEEAENYEEGNSVIVKFDDDKRIKMSVYQISLQSGKSRLILSCNRYYENFDRYRVANCRLIRSSKSGIILENNSIVEENGQKGVYVLNKFGNATFVPIKILSTDRDRTVVEKNYFYDGEGKSITTVKNYDEIIRKEVKSNEDEESDENVN